MLAPGQAAVIKLHETLGTPSDSSVASLNRTLKGCLEAPPKRMVDRLPEDRHPKSNVGALIIRIGFWGPTYYIHNRERPK